jgi:predicted  nucleic acid-binding Zn-ribbon protein
MALEGDEIKKINDLYKELDQKELKIQSIDNNLVTAQNTVNFLNQSIENYKEIVSELSGKMDTVISHLDQLTKTSKAKK